MSKFSTNCFRDFKKYIGELTATSAGIFVAIQYTSKIGLNSANTDSWAVIAQNFGVKVDGLKSERVLSSAARLNIVNVYSGFDFYLSTFRKKLYQLMVKEWRADKKDTPFDEFRRNIPLNKIEEADEIVTCQIQLIDYYRLARNTIVHPSKENEQSVCAYFKENTEGLQRVKSHYGMAGAPNEFANLDFHDVKLFARTLLDILPEFDATLDPGNERLKKLIPFEKWSNYNESRKKNAAVGFLKNEYGLDQVRALEILAH